MADVIAGDIITNYIFKVDGCFDMRTAAPDIDTARKWTERMWPRSTIEFVREEFSHIVEDITKKHIPIRPMVKHGIVVNTSVGKKSRAGKSSKSVEENMVETVASMFDGSANF